MSTDQELFILNPNDDRGYESAPLPKTKQSLWRTLLQALRLNIVYSVWSKFRGREHPEPEKVAMYKSRGQALMRCSVHLLPVLAALALVILNITQFYVGGELRGASGQDQQKLAALQFAAKLHELLMLASLGAIVFSYIRKELAFGGGIPFGALFAGFQIEKLSLLWSSEFWGTVTHKWTFQQRRKFYLISLIVACTLLGVSVGPSTANLMKPRLDDWPGGGTTYWINATENQLYPTFTDSSPALAHCEQDTGDAACPHGGWEAITQGYLSFWPRLAPQGSMPYGVTVASPFSLREILVRQRTVASYDAALGTNAYTMATTQLSAPSDGLTEVGRLWTLAAPNGGGIQRWDFRKDATFTTSMSQPFVMARCEASQVASHVDDISLEFPVLSSLYLTGSTLASYGHANLNKTYLLTDSAAQEIVKSMLAQSSPSLIWYDTVSLLQATNSSISAIAVFPNTTVDTSSIYICGVDSRFAPGIIQATANEPKEVTGGPPNWWNTGIVPTWPRTSITADWASLLNPSIPATNTTVFNEMVAAAGMWNSSLPSDSYNYPFIIETILTTLIADGLARGSYNTPMVGTLKSGPNWYKNFLPEKVRLSWGGDAFTVTDAERTTATMFTMRATANGYAYSYKGATQKAAIAVLIVYVLLALGHVVYSGRTGWTSTAWDTMPEIAALAMSSSQSSRLQNTGAGIYTMRVYQENVKTRVRDQRVEFVFEDTREGSGTLLTNQHYS